MLVLLGVPTPAEDGRRCMSRRFSAHALRCQHCAQREIAILATLAESVLTRVRLRTRRGRRRRMSFGGDLSVLEGEHGKI